MLRPGLATFGSQGKPPVKRLQSLEMRQRKPVISKKFLSKMFSQPA